MTRYINETHKFLVGLSADGKISQAAQELGVSHVCLYRNVKNNRITQNLFERITNSFELDADDLAVLNDLVARKKEPRARDARTRTKYNNETYRFLLDLNPSGTVAQTAKQLGVAYGCLHNSAKVNRISQILFELIVDKFTLDEDATRTLEMLVARKKETATAL